MQKSDFTFDLPEDRIAQRPAKPRDASRLMLLRRGGDQIEHHVFRELPGLLEPGDLLVMNDTRVLPARLIGHKTQSGGVCELLLLRSLGAEEWECLAKPGKRLRPGASLVFGDGSLEARVLEELDQGRKKVAFSPGGGAFMQKLEQFGAMPLPPYIKSRLEDKEEYQTVFSRAPGSAAAPTAGLHFTPDLLDALKAGGIATTFLTLHVGLGTFRPVQAPDIRQHQMHSEAYTLGQEAATAIQAAKARGSRVIAVGTTSCRTLESVAAKYGEIRPHQGETNIFLYPGAEFRVIDGLLTNFHLPESTLIMLVAAFYGRQCTLAAYRLAVEQQYRFYSFGDAMLIL